MISRGFPDFFTLGNQSYLTPTNVSKVATVLHSLESVAIIDETGYGIVDYHYFSYVESLRDDTPAIKITIDGTQVLYATFSFMWGSGQSYGIDSLYVYDNFSLYNKKGVFHIRHPLPFKESLKVEIESSRDPELIYVTSTAGIRMYPT